LMSSLVQIKVKLEQSGPIPTRPKAVEADAANFPEPVKH